MNSQTSGALPIEKTTPKLAEVITQEIVSLHDMQARKHDCPGYDCATCSLHGLQSQIEEIVGNGLADILTALKAMYADCFSDQESLLSLVIGNGPAMANPANENANKLRERCDRIAKAFELAQAAIAKAESGQ